MKMIILDEVETGARIRNRELVWENPYELARLAARYDRQVLGLSPEETERDLRELVRERYRIPERAGIYSSLANYARHGDKVPLHVIPKVSIFRDEMESVMKLPRSTDRRLYFACLAVARYEALRKGGGDGWLSGGMWPELARRANLSIGAKGRYESLHRLGAAGYLVFGDGVTNLSARPAELPMEGDAAVSLDTEDFLWLGYKCRAACGERLSRCPVCGKWMKQAKVGRPRVYCGGRRCAKTRVRGFAGIFNEK